jgi:hypothetical protein
LTRSVAGAIVEFEEDRVRQKASLTAAAAVVALSASVHAEQVVLKNGGRVNGILLERTRTHVVMQVGPGQVSIPLASVERVVEGRSALSVFAERSARLAGNDRSGWLELGLWARDAGLDTQARESFARVLALDPQNPTAHAALGDVLLDGRWVDADAAHRARGYVRFEGSWMLPEERDEMLRDRAARREEQRARAETETRVQEAEARARAAEAAAREAEAAAAGYGYGMPIGYYDPYGVVIGGAGVQRQRSRPPHAGAGHRTPHTRPEPLRPSSINPPRSNERADGGANRDRDSGRRR